nr:MAG TPA: hypothetical protein [Bacteriophage sp.]
MERSICANSPYTQSTQIWECESRVEKRGNKIMP